MNNGPSEPINSPLTTALRLASPLFLAAGGLHVALGLQADMLLGAMVSAQTQIDAGLDSQNRFYGACFMVYGVLLWLSTSDLRRYAPVVSVLLWALLAAGLVRFISVWKFGWPPPLISLLFALEVLLPPVVLIWLGRLRLGD